MPLRRAGQGSEECRGFGGCRVAFAAVALSVALVTPGAARAYGDFVGRAELSYQNDQGLGASDEYFRQVYYLLWRRQVTDPITLRLTFRYQDDRGTLDTGEKIFSLQARQIMPAASLEYRLDTLYLLAAWSRNDNEILDGETGRWMQRAYNQLTGLGWYRPQENLEATWYVGQANNQAFGIDTRQRRAGVGFIGSWGGLRLEGAGQYQLYQDSQIGLTRSTLAPRLGVQYAVDGGRSYSFSARYNLEYFWVTQETQLAGQGSVPSEIQPVVGLFVVNPIPIDTSATPMQPEPRLIDGVLEVSAGISLGPDGVSFQNIGVDMGRATTLDQLRVVVRGGSGQFVQFGGPVSWTVWVSQDGTRWIQVDEALARFDLGLSTYLVDFRPTVGRYFKVVNFGVNTVETLVTELQTFAAAPVSGATKRESNALRQTVGLSGMWRPWEKLQLIYNGQFDTNRATGFGRSPVWFSDLSNLFSANVGPFSGFTVGLSQTATRVSQPGGYLQASYFTMGYLAYQPVESAEARLEARYGIDRVEFRQTNTPSVGLSAYANPYESLRFSGSVLLSRQQIVDGGTTDFLSAGATAYIDILRDLELRFELAMQRTVQTSGDVSAQETVPLFRIVNYARTSVFLRYRPNSQLDLVAGIGYSSSAQGSGLLQSYLARWYPFPNGSVHLDMEYREEVDSLTGRSYRQVSVVPRWNVNRFLQLQLSYNKIQGTGSVPISQQTLFAQLTLFI